jgi:hypothetical protein
MTFPTSIERLAARVLALSAVAAGLTLAGCSSETIDASSAKNQKSTYSNEVNQATKARRPIVTKSVKSLIAKDTAKE